MSQAKIQETMIAYGFDFLLTGTGYIYEMVLEMVNNINFSNGIKLMQYISDKHGVKFKTMNRSVRWSIGNATKKYHKFEKNISTNKLVKKICYDLCS